MSSSLSKMRKKMSSTQRAGQLRKEAEKGDGIVTVRQLKPILAQIERRFEGIAEVIHSNTQVIQGGFLRQDIWTEVLRTALLSVISDVADDLKDRGRGLDMEHLSEHWEDLWKEAAKKVQQEMDARRNKPVEAASPDPATQEVIFGGDYTGEQDVQSA